MRTTARFETSAEARLRREIDRRAQAAALQATKEAAEEAKGSIRSAMAQAGLGTLGMGIGSGSDAQKTGTVHAKDNGRWSASGWVFIRSQSPRTVGAIISYTEGSTITPRRGRYLWIATDDVKRLVGLPIPKTGGGKGTANFRLEPRYWDRTYGRTLGPLVPIRSKDGTPLLVVRNATLSASGKPGSIKSLSKTGKVPKGQVAQDFVVAFYAIPNTRRAARIDPRDIARNAAAALPAKLGTSFEVEIS